MRIWDSWADENGELGNIYGKQWRRWRKNYAVDIDQIFNVIQSIKYHPYSRRHIVSAWNVGELNKMALLPCHYFFQFYVSEGKHLSCLMSQRSADFFLGSCFNIASYALLTYMIAQVTNLKPKELIISMGDVHIYNNHLEQVSEQLTREPYDLPLVVLNPEIKNIDYFTFDDIDLLNYKHHPAIKASIAI